MNNPFEDLEAKLAPSNSIRGALFILRNDMAALGGHDISYEYMLRKNSYIRADVINMTTLSSEVTDLYVPSGGTNSDPIIESFADSTDPLFVDLKKLTADRASKFYKNKFFSRLAQQGYPYLSAFPFSDNIERGYGVFTIFDSRPKAEVEPFSEEIMSAALEFHKSIQALSHITRYFGLSEKEISTLERAAIGKTAADIAAQDGITKRTIELRLETARKKLRARTTTEAVYKGVSYGVLRPE